MRWAMVLGSLPRLGGNLCRDRVSCGRKNSTCLQHSSDTVASVDGPRALNSGPEPAHVYPAYWTATLAVPGLILESSDWARALLPFSRGVAFLLTQTNLQACKEQNGDYGHGFFLF